MENTRTGVQSEILRWARDESGKNVMWLNGAAGSGKSTVAQTIADLLQGHGLGCYAFYDRGKSSPNIVIRGAALQLVRSNNAVALRMYNAVGSVDILSASVKLQFELLFMKALTEAADQVEGPIIIILDALDECGSVQDRRDLMEVLSGLTKLPKKFRFLITSRPEPDIEDMLGSNPGVVSFELGPDAGDVQAYLDYEMPKAFKKDELEHIQKSWPWAENMKVLGKAANGLFIWASTAVKYISEGNFKFRLLRTLVTNASAGQISLHSLYATTLKEALTWDDETKSVFTRVMALILFGKVRLSNDVIDGILGLEPDEGSDYILSRIQSLVAYKRGEPIHLYHTSLYDYLTTPDGSADPWLIDVSSAKQMVTKRSFVVMRSLLHFNMGKLA